jgi:hypothetical protein
LLKQCNTSNPGKLDRAVADKANKAKDNADSVSNWLSQQCNQDDIITMMTDQIPLTISLAVFQALCKIEVDISESKGV